MKSEMADLTNAYPLHECVFHNDVARLSSLLRTNTDIAKRDRHGNTALHLAVMLGHRECVHLLLAHNSPVKVKNSAGWGPLAEAISYGDRQIIVSLLRKVRQQTKDQLRVRQPKLLEALKQMGDFYLQVNWDFQSWLPLVSRMLPSDVCRIHKKGVDVRVDTTLVDFNNMHWERGDVSFVFKGSAKPNESLFLLDNKQKVYHKVKHEESENEIEEEVDILMASDIVAVQMSTKCISFNRTQTGFFFTEDKTEMVGAYEADFYSIGGLALESKKRREHLSQEDLKKNKSLMETLTKGSSSSLADSSGGDPSRRPSLAPPLKTSLSWSDYLRSAQQPIMGRPVQCKEVTKTFRANVAMSQHFPLSTSMLLDVLEVVAPVKHLNKLREFVEMKLPPGFPVKIDVPILPTITARVSFQEFKFRADIPDSLFEIPRDYKENPKSFADV